MNTDFRPDFERNIRGCLEKYKDVEGALKWFARAEGELSSEGFVDLVDATIQDKYEDEPRFSKIFILRNHKKIAAHSREDVKVLLEEGRSEEADELFHKIKQIFNDGKCKELRDEYRAESLANDLKDKGTTLYTMDDDETLSLAYQIIKHNPRLCDNFSLEGLGSFVVRNIGSLVFPLSLYSILLRDIAAGVNEDEMKFDQGTVRIVLEKILSYHQRHKLDGKSVWTILCAYPTMLKEFSASHKAALDGLADSYPFEHLVALGSIYPPPETECLNYLKEDLVSLQDESFDQLKSLFQRNRYFNCEMVLALRKAKFDHRTVSLKDILDDLLKEIVNRAFNYNLEFKNPIKNLIFPKCVSNSWSDSFKVSHDDLIFCEGRRLKRRENGEVYMYCRNRQCIERTEQINTGPATQTDNYFLGLLRDEFGISTDDVSPNKDFIHAMGAFNRWNEIAERLVCGYGGTSGCGSTLMFRKSPQVEPGRAAYATTYWRCSNPSCKHVEKTIKLSHCRKCRKIIDSRFDKISCKRRDPNEFFICMDCGYCCDQHEVSGICPECGKNEGWEGLDQHGKRYRCKACGHEIAVPGSKRHCLDSGAQTNGIYTAKSVARSEKMDLGSDYDDIPFDDIPF